jgi:hypothetical protein
MELQNCRIAILLIGSCFNVADLGKEHIKFDLVCFRHIVGSGNFFLVGFTEEMQILELLLKDNIDESNHIF